jgi:hypothetical protein
MSFGSDGSAISSTVSPPSRQAQARLPVTKPWCSA